MDTDKTTLIDAQSDIDGKLKGRDARVLGRFRGEIELSGRLATGEGSKLEARLRADAAEIAGEFNGEIHVRSLVLTEKARVQGTVHAELISMREGAVLQASVSSGPLAKPAAQRPGAPAATASAHAATPAPGTAGPAAHAATAAPAAPGARAAPNAHPAPNATGSAATPAAPKGVPAT